MPEPEPAAGRGLDASQQAVVDAPLGPVAVIAGPGSGKTATLVRRIAKLAQSVPASTLLALTHTGKAAGELQERLAGAGVAGSEAATIHSVAWRQVRHYWTQSGRTGTPVLVGSPWALVRDAAVDVLGRTLATSEAVSELTGEIDWARARLLDVGQWQRAAREQGRVVSVDAARVDAVWERAEALKHARGLLDFGDVLSIAAEMSAHRDVRARVLEKWSALFVDEYQDVDLAQQRLIDAWLAGRDTLCAVGDPEQAIFGFKGGDANLLLCFSERYPDATVLHLGTNYRSGVEVVDVVNRLTVTSRPALVSAAGVGARVSIVDAPTETHEENALVDFLCATHASGVSYDEMAVLYRFNATSARIEGALTRAKIPHHVAGSARFFERPEVRAVLISFGQRARDWTDASGVDMLVSCAHDTGWDPDAPPDGVGPARQRWEAVSALVGMAFEQHPDSSAAELLQVLQTRAREAHDLTPGGVTLATVHGAKGLEWDAVWVVGVTEGQMPSAYAKTPAQIREEQHLLYVAASRARWHLCLSWARRRHNGWRSEPSRFLHLLSEGHRTSSHPPTRATTLTRTAGLSGEGVVDGGAHPQNAACVVCGGRLVGMAARTVKRCSPACLDPTQAARHVALCAWRASVAAQQHTSERSIATDKALFHMAALGTADGVAGLRAAHTPPL